MKPPSRTKLKPARGLRPEVTYIDRSFTQHGLVHKNIQIKRFMLLEDLEQFLEKVLNLVLCALRTDLST